MPLRLLALLAALVGLAVVLVGCPARRAPSTAAEAPTLVVYLVRHAEKVDASADPELSEAGRQRVATLVELLADAGLYRAYTTDYVRTRDTGGPVAAAQGIDLLIYDPTGYEVLAGKLHEHGGHNLVVGHSNTVPAIVEQLGGDPGEPIEEATEYDRLYVVRIFVDGRVESELRRFGAPYVPVQ
jgi:phosphohistidine phosphatase SixA